jgi:hypothetical protein
MPPNGGTTCRFMRPRALVPPTIQLGNSGINKSVPLKLSLMDLEARQGDKGQALLAA